MAALHDLLVKYKDALQFPCGILTIRYIIHIIQKPCETLPSQVFQVVLLRVNKGQRARSAFRGTVPFGTLRVGLQSHFWVYIVSQPIVDISMMLWLLIISSRDLCGATIWRGDNSRVVLIKFIGISNLVFFRLGHKWNTLCVSKLLGTQLQSTHLFTCTCTGKQTWLFSQTPPLISRLPPSIVADSIDKPWKVVIFGWHSLEWALLISFMNALWPQGCK